MYTNTAIQEHSDPTPAQDLVVSGNTEHKLRGKERGKEEQQKRSQREADSGFSGQDETPPCSFMQRSSHPLANSIQNDDCSNRIVGEPPQSTNRDATVPPIFKVGSVSNEVDETDNGASTERTPVQEESISDSDSAEEDVGVKPVQGFNEKIAQIYLSPSIVAMLTKQKNEIERLNQEKIALEQEMKMLKDCLKEVEKKAKENEDIAKKHIQEKINELEEYKTKLSQIEREKEEMESQYQGRIKKLEEDLVELERDKKDKEKDAELEKAKLKSQLSQARMELCEKDLLISEQKGEIAKLEFKNALQKKEAEHRTALEEKDAEHRIVLEQKDAEHRSALEVKDTEIKELKESLRDLNLCEETSFL